MPENEAKQDPWTASDWEDAIRAVFRKSLEDPAFRKLAKSEPLTAIETASGRTPPSGIQINFTDHLEEKTYVLPKSDTPASQLSEVDISRILYHSYRSQAVLPRFS